ncbi:sensor histidine kinase [Dinghuibacter silviterrae]|uniref:Histidine kinase n=1 Tax=Dinghuibacter silviterrae TaxID=1539049 RepID=A0A4R8DUD0_9BACT|nr:sensor histidine kinase [Dinghuibacter silviterrae]TDX01974.1 histidine kinase [Dinghuibacter silviterrae]
MLPWRKYRHVNFIFWTGYFLYEWLANSVLDDAYKANFYQAIIYTSVSIVAAWVTLHIVLLRFFLPERKPGAWWVLAASIVACTLLRRVFSYYIIYRHFHPEYLQWHKSFWSPKIIGEAAWMYLVVGFNNMLYFMRAWYEQQRISEVLKKDKAIAQLELLKSQVHPHFIFNTLNNIYSLSLHQDRRTPDMIHRLSSLLSYMLYDSKDAVIPVSKEIEYVQNYIELQKIRYSDRLDVSINVFLAVDGFFVAPLLLLPLVENCFKHGVASEAGRAWIRMDLSRDGDWLVVKLENSVAEKCVTETADGARGARGDTEAAGGTTETAGGAPLVNRASGPGVNGHAVPENGGIGLDNVRRRLEILYPEQHDFKTLSEAQSFLAVLKIKNQAP